MALAKRRPPDEVTGHRPNRSSSQGSIHRGMTLSSHETSGRAPEHRAPGIARRRAGLLAAISVIAVCGCEKGASPASSSARNAARLEPPPADVAIAVAASDAGGLSLPSAPGSEE